MLNEVHDIYLFYASFYDQIDQYYWTANLFVVKQITEYYQLYGYFTSCKNLSSNNRYNDNDADTHFFFLQFFLIHQAMTLTHGHRIVL